MLKYVLANVWAVASVSLVVTGALYLLMFVLLGALSFAFWGFPSITLAGTVMFTRFCIAVGVVLGIIFIFTEEGKGFVEDVLERGQE